MNTNTITESSNKNNRVIKTAVTKIIGTKIVSVNQVLITIHTNPMVRIRQNAVSDSLQCSVPLAPLSSEYLSNSFLSVKDLMNQFCQ